MTQTNSDDILELLEQSNSVEELLVELDSPQRSYEVISALEGEGRMYQLENAHHTRLTTSTSFNRELAPTCSLDCSRHCPKWS